MLNKKYLLILLLLITTIHPIATFGMTESEKQSKIAYLKSEIARLQSILNQMLYSETQNATKKAPVISYIDPVSGPNNTTINIYGDNFDSKTTVQTTIGEFKNIATTSKSITLTLQTNMFAPTENFLSKKVPTPNNTATSSKIFPFPILIIVKNDYGQSSPIFFNMNVPQI